MVFDEKEGSILLALNFRHVAFYVSDGDQRFQTTFERAVRLNARLVL
jgi:hypothetical protein